MRATVAIFRAAIGLAQGVALNWLYNAADAKIWPATDGPLFSAAVLCAVYVPVVAIAGLHNLRTRTFAIWIVVASAVLAGFGAYDILRDPITVAGGDAPRNLPGVLVWAAAAVGLFIAHALIVSGDSDRKFIAAYPRYFDIAWKHGVQVVMAALFVGIFWQLLWLGADLFKLIKIEYFAELIRKRWFAIPVTTLAVAYAIHTTDVRATLVQGVRTLTLTLLSWLLPLMALIAVGFLAALLFTGLEALWSTRRAATMLLLAAGTLVLLINAAYQDGGTQSRVARILRHAGTIATVALLPLVAIAAYAVALRVGQHGWTPERIIASAWVVVTACYAGGYLLAAATRGPWLKGIEAANIFSSFVILAVLLALLSPVADPARISVADQVARLEDGRISPDAFDYAFLRFKSGRYGRDALERLRTEQNSPDAARIAEKANAALAAKFPSEARLRIDRPTPAERAANITVIYPNRQALPMNFLQQDWNALPDQWRYPRCLTAKLKCEAVLLDLDGDDKPEILIFLPVGLVPAFKETDGKWAWLGSLANANCKGVREALVNGDFKLVAPDFRDLQVAGQQLYVLPPGCR